MQEKNLDAAIIGAGTAGLYAASRVSHKTENFLLFEGGVMGTTCARVGCMPSKGLIAVARNFSEVSAHAFPALRHAACCGLDVASALDSVRQVRDRLAGSTADNARHRFQDHLVTKTVSFAEPMVLTDGETLYRAKAVILATGSTPFVPPGWNVDSSKIVTTDSFFELEEIGQKVLVVGMGPVGLELGQAMARLGLSVTGVEMGDQVAALSDPEVKKTLLDILENEPNLDLHLKTTARLMEAGDKVRVALEPERGGAQEMEFDLVLLAVGRRPNLSGLELEKSGLALDSRGRPEFDPHTLKCEGENVFMAGDASGIRPFYHDAADQGSLAGKNAVAGGELESLPPRVPLTVVFTEPGTAFAGADFSTLDPEKTVIGKAMAANSGRGIVEGGKQGHIRLYFDRKTQVLLGAQMTTPAAEHLAHFLAPMIHSRYTVGDMLNLPYYHPTYEELIQSAAQNAKKQMKG